MIWIIVALSACLLNFFLVCIMVLLERKKPEFIMFWLFVIVFLPILGFIIYLIVGTPLNRKIKKQIAKKQISSSKYDLYESKNYNNSNPESDEFIKFLKCFGADNCCSNSKIDFFNSSYEKIQALKRDIKNAKNSINMEYYIFKNDKIGREILSMLCKKASQGVIVNLIYDAVGSISVKKGFFKKLKKAGGIVTPFFPSALGFKFLNTKFNYRNHRKIVVIDGVIAYSGGMNICLDEVKNKKIRPWRDLHIRVEGPSASVFQNLFLSDFRYAINDSSPPVEYIYNDKYYPNITNDNQGNIISVVTSGPDKRLQSIKEVMIKLISMAKKSIIIQTPYFVPDDVFLTSIRLACFSGVKIKIMLPLKPDRKIMQQVAFSFAAQLSDFGVEFYLYDGFIHSKLMIVDNEIAMMGSCNIDNRSFSLNFEVNTIFYDSQNLEKLLKISSKDFENSFRASKSYLLKGMSKTKIGQGFLTLIYPLL